MLAPAGGKANEDACDDMRKVAGNGDCPVMFLSTKQKNARANCLRERPDGVDISGSSDGTPLHISGTVTTADGTPLANAWVDVWQADDDGYYDVQKPGDEEELRARFRSDAEGKFSFWTIVPTSYPIPADGPVGQMLIATGRHPYRPAHIHFMIGQEGYETLVTHLFVAGDPYLTRPRTTATPQLRVVS